MPNDKLKIGDVEITSLSDGILEFDLCNFFPDIPEDDWKGQEHHLSATLARRCGSALIRKWHLSCSSLSHWTQ